jgi:hypothetical protein
VRYSPVVTVIGSGRQRLQPIWVDDVAAYVSAALELPQAAGRTFELGGPDQVDWDELYRRIARTLGRRRPLVHVPARLARTGARLTEWIPGSPLTADQVTMLEQGGDNVVHGTFSSDPFALPLVHLDEQLRRGVSSSALAPDRPRDTSKQCRKPGPEPPFERRNSLHPGRFYASVAPFRRRRGWPGSAGGAAGAVSCRSREPGGGTPSR